MPNRLARLLAGGLLLAAVAAAPALAAPAAVTVRVEGATQTLVPRTPVTTTTNPVVKDGNPAHSCTGTSTAGALDLATGGDWGGSWFDGLGYAAERIKGEAHVFPQPEFFSFWLNNKESMTGICQTELQAGDEVLFYVARCVSDPMTFACTNPPVLPLGLNAPKTATVGAPFNVTVVEYASNGTPTPVAGATVTTSGGNSATTGADGVTSIALPAGADATLRATAPNRAPSATETVCVTTGSEGRCGTADKTHAFSFVRGIAEQQRFAAGAAPRTLRGDASADPSGLAAVKLRLTRNDRGECSYFSGRQERFRAVRCGAANGKYFTLGDRAEWSYLLPATLARGRYVLDVVTIDKAGNREPLARGRNRIVFHVG